jgi:hypothetical protein
MQIQKANKIKRKNFFTKSLIGLIGAAFIPGSLVNLLKKRNKTVTIQINPNAVSRKNR